MPNFKLHNKGVALLIVLVTIFVVVLLANIALNTMVSQGRFTQHKVGRIQAEYVAWAATNYAHEMIRSNAWNSGSCPGPNGCLFPVDGNLPTSIIQNTASSVRIFITPSGIGVCLAPAGCVCVSVQVQYVNPTP